MDIHEKSINTIKALAAQSVANAKSGHTGSAISAAPMLYALFNDHLNFLPTNPNYAGRDRFVMSAGHVSALLYSILHVFGYDIKIDDLKNFRNYGSKTPGHPEYRVAPGVETTTGPLGQGVANAVGMAIAETMLAAKFNTKDISLFNNYTYCYCGDGCLMEGVAMEACSLAGTLNLNKLVLLYEDNNITIDGARTIANAEDTALKFRAMGWEVIVVRNGNDYYSCSKAISMAKRSSAPTIIIFKTTIGIGTALEGQNKIHAHPLSDDELKDFLKKLGIKKPFYVDAEIVNNVAKQIIKNTKKAQKWHENLKKYATKYPEQYKLLNNLSSVKKFNYEKLLQKLNKLGSVSGRDLSSLVLNELSKTYTELIGGAADLVASTKAVIDDGEFYSIKLRGGKNVHFGIREHAMGAISNGMSLYQKQPVFDSTFLIFSNYMLPAIRSRAMMKLPVVSIFTHDSINIGQDGPTHQPIESLTILRSIPDYTVFRPATAAEIIAGYKTFFEKRIPLALALTKSNLPVFEQSTIEDAERGGYIIFESKAKPKIEIFATGTEVELAISVAKELSSFGARVISMPCESIFASQDSAYKNKILSSNAAIKVAIEASNDNVWYKYIGENGILINVTDYQCSGPGNEVYKKAGFDKDVILSQIAKQIKALKI